MISSTLARLSYYLKSEKQQAISSLEKTIYLLREALPNLLARTDKEFAAAWSPVISPILLQPGANKEVVNILKATLNANSSEVYVEVSLNLVEQINQTIARVYTAKLRSNRQKLDQRYTNKLTLNELVQFRVTNRDTRDLYFTILLMDSTGGLVVAFPYTWAVSNESMQLKAGQSVIVGDTQQLRLRSIETGSGEALIIFSRSPLKNAVKALQSLAEEQKQTLGTVALSRGQLDVIGNLLDDLSSDR
ncbi:MAG TPA: hypothetical protein DCE56_43235 [Cyanobacteria bacterium UBA8553]|nr:hypothetical protein [Cyanobacteria bacterium UBA8553]